MTADSNSPYISILIPTYNRRDLVVQSIRSSKAFSIRADGKSEIIVIDDASTDGTSQHLASLFPDDISNGSLLLIQLPENRGVTAARTEGAMYAKGQWITFLDSDDTLIPEAAPKLMSALRNAAENPIVFFRCEDMVTQKLIGAPQRRPYLMKIESFLNKGTPGECLPVIQTSVFKKMPYLPSLSGCEGISYAGIIHRAGPARVEPTIARRYRRDSTHRLSSRLGILKRSCDIARYHYLLLRDFGKYLMTSKRAECAAKFLLYSIVCLSLKSISGKGSTR